MRGRMIIYFETVEIQLRDIPQVLRELGYSVQTVDLQIKAQGFNKETCDKIVGLLKEEKPECVISYDFAPTISRACLEMNVPYISWVYDDPQQELYTQEAQYPNNYIFVFDKQQKKRLEQIGIRNVYHMPLAIYGDKVKKALQQAEKFAGQYEAEIAFVGQLYRMDNLERLMEQADSKVQAAMEECIAGCFLNWDNQTKMHGTMQNSCVAYFSAVDGQKVTGRFPYVSEPFYYEAAVLSRILANRERVAILNDLAQDRDVKFYTFDREVKGLSDKVKICQGAKYDTEVSHVYCQSKINLNITLHCIETGISQRVFDVMAAGGFLLTNYQEELEELFVPGEDIAIYHNLEELHYYVDYYLSHEEERQRIARNGQAKVLQYHDFHTRMAQVMEIVREQEEKRVESYLEEWNRIKPESEMMEELVLCRDLEIKLGRSQLFQGIDNMQAAKEKYFVVWKKLWEITEHSDENLYAELCRVIIEKKIPSIYAVWHIYVKKQERETILLQLCEYMRQYYIVTAIELVSYGLLITPQALNLLLKKAECLMDLSMWTQALDTLKQIREPKDDVLMLIQELEEAIGT